jgi:hypothetical protein
MKCCYIAPIVFLTFKGLGILFKKVKKIGGNFRGPCLAQKGEMDV